MFRALFLLFVVLVPFSALAVPDYRIQPGSVQTTATAGYRHERFTVNARIENLGDGGTAGLRVRFRFMSISNPGENYRARTVTAQGAINESGSPIINYGSNPAFQQILMPHASMPPGNYRLQSWIDPEFEDEDSDRLNNFTDLIPSFTLHPSPDLQARLVFPDGDHAAYHPGETVTIQLGLRNVGDPTDIGASTIDIYLFNDNLDSVIGASDSWNRLRNDENTVFIGSLATRTIDKGLQESFPGAWFNQDLTFPFPSGLNRERWGVIAHYNPNNTVPEPPDSEDNATGDFGGNYARNPPHIDLISNEVVQRPDFVAEHRAPYFSPDNLPAGSFITVHGKVLNDSLFASTETSVVEFALSSVAGGANYYRVSLGTSPLPALPGRTPGGSVYSVNYQETFRIPIDTPPGDYRFVIKADPIDAIPESDDENNSSGGYPYDYVNVLPAIAPNLEVNGNVAVTPSTASPGDTVTFSLPVRNAGNGAAGQFDTSFFAGETLIDTVRTSATLSPLAETTLTLTAQLPASLQPGDYRIYVHLDSAEDIEETVEQERETAGFVFLNVVPPGPPSFPDLAIDQLIEIQDAGKFGAEGAISFQFANQGNLQAASCDFALYLSPDAEAGGNDIFLNSGSLPAVTAGAREEAMIDFLLPEQGVTGPYWFVVKLDSGEAISESDELNNVHVFQANPIALSNGNLPTIALGSRGLDPSTVLPGQEVLQFFSLANDGPGDVGGVVCEVLLSPDPVPGNGNDVLLGRFGPMTIANGDEAEFSDYALIPFDTLPGSYYLIWSVDPENLVPHAGGDPFWKSRPLIVRERRLRAEVFERTKTHDRIALYDTWPEFTYRMFWGDDLSDLDQEAKSQPGNINYPVIFEIENSDGETLQRFFRALEEE